MQSHFRSISQWLSGKISRFPRLHQTLRRIFFALPRQLRGEQMVYDHLKTRFENSRNPVTFCLVGANDGTTNDHIFPFAKRMGWRGILVEPVPTYFEELKKAYEGLPVVFENVAIHKSERSMLLHYLDAAKASLPSWAKGVGSFQKENLDLIDDLPNRDEAIVTKEVSCFPLAEVVERSGLDHIDIFVIDVEGYDGEIVRQIEFDSWKVQTVVFEHKLLKPDDLALCIELLEKNGFTHSRDNYDLLATREL